jgi:hypothetical protein
MNKEQLKIAKRIAEIEGIELTKHMGGVLYKNNQGCMLVNGMAMDWYNPFDWSVFGPLMVKYEVEIAYWLNAASVELNNGDTFTINFKDKSEIPTAILKCIIKSKE